MTALWELLATKWLCRGDLPDEGAPALTPHPVTEAFAALGGPCVRGGVFWGPLTPARNLAHVVLRVLTGTPGDAQWVVHSPLCKSTVHTRGRRSHARRDRDPSLSSRIWEHV